VNIKKKEIKK